MTAASMELAHAAEMTTTANTLSAEVAASSTKMCTATVESTAATEMATSTSEMRAATTATTAHVNATAPMPAAAATWTRVGRNGQSCQEGCGYDCDFKKMSHGFTPRI